MADTPERIAKVLARAASPRAARPSGLIEAGRIAVKRQDHTSPALNVTPADRITFDGKARRARRHPPASGSTTSPRVS